MPAPAGAVGLRVLTYNVHALRDDVAALARVVTSSGAQFVFVQEAPSWFRWRARCAELARRCQMVVVAGGGGDAVGNLLMASLGVQVHSARSIPLARMPGMRRRGAALAHCSVDGAEFLAVGTHLSLRAEERAVQAQRLLAEVPPDSPPLVVAGDINEDSTGAAWGAFAARLTDAGAVTGNAATPTFSCAAPRRRIDGIFVDRRATVRAYAVPNSADVRAASDHFPVYAELGIPGTQT